MREALRRSAAVLLRHAGGDGAFELKNGTDPVTAADREVDVLLRGLLPGPGDGWLSEESEDDRTRLGRDRVWVVDPLDGTRAFLARRPEYATSIGLLVGEAPAFGGVVNPATGVTVIGGPAHGLLVEGHTELPWSDGPGDRLRVLGSRSEWKRGEWQRWFDGSCRLLPMGSVAYKLALVAAGYADATWTLQPKHEWDVAAGAALVLATGGEVWLPDGNELAWNREHPRFATFAACRRGLRGRVEELLRRPG